MTEDERFMRRCLQLAQCGRRNARPNPMVGAVVVARGRIIGEGYHVRWGEAHAEVNALASVAPADAPLLAEATLYVSLEPCAHHGKTPPCADLIVERGLGRVVVGCLDDFAQVQGRGVERLRRAGIAVEVGVLEEECRRLNRHFLTYHRERRPYIVLKWAQTANGFLDDELRPVAISTAYTQMLAHRMRTEVDAILVGRVTAERDRPRLDVRHWSGPSPRRLVVDRRHPLQLDALHAHGVQALLVEGGAQTLQWFIDRGLWDELRVETNHALTVAGGTRAPQVPACARLVSAEAWGANTIDLFERRPAARGFL